MEIYTAGFTGSGPYLVDATGSRNEGWAVKVWCDRGFTYVLKRGQHDLNQVSNA